MPDPSEKISIRVQNLGKCFKFFDNKWARLSGALFGSSNHCQKLWALRHLDLQIPEGKTVGVIGQNGSGKTTLLQLIAGLLKPTEGSVEVRGNLATLLELESAFHSQLTGRENIFVSGGLKGFSRRQIESKLADIITFSELEDFIDRPIKHYSSGMLMRLGFSTAISIQPDVLLIDEVFAVGDIAFQYKCTRKFRELQKNGTTIVLVSHDMNAVKSFCDYALLLDAGKAVKFGSPEEVTNDYLDLISQKYAGYEHREKSSSQPTREPVKMEFLSNLMQNDKMHRFGTGEGRICGIQILDANSLPAEMVRFGEEVAFRFFLEYLKDVPRSGIGFYIRDRYGTDIIGMNTFEENMNLGNRKSGDRIIVEFRMPLLLRPGAYSISPGFAYDRTEPKFLDWIDNALFFELIQPPSGKKVHGLIHVPNHVSLYLVEG